MTPQTDDQILSALDKLTKYINHIAELESKLALQGRSDPTLDRRKFEAIEKSDALLAEVWERKLN